MPPVLLQDGDHPSRSELDPGVILQFVYPWFTATDAGDVNTRNQMAQELQNSAANQDAWLDIAAQLPRLDLFSPLLAWERSLITGHPTHPLHKALFAQPPLGQVRPEEISNMVSPEILFLSVPRSQVSMSGPYEATLDNLLSKLNIPRCSDDRVTIPCLAQQKPAILARFSDVQLMGSDRATAQASMRTVTLRPELQFNYHMKLSLACQITSALRTISPWSALGGPEVSDLLHELLPPDLWVFREIAGVTGAQANFDDAKHFSCILREDLEVRADLQDESLIVAAALAQRPVGNIDRPQNESLVPRKGRKEWFQKYVSMLLKLILVPLASHGVGMEAHGQNLCVRICRKTKEIRGFAIRDFGGIGLHMPTLRSQGFDLLTVPSGSSTMTDDIDDVWSRVHHALFQNHLAHLIVGLDLEDDGGWEIVRNEVKALSRPANGPPCPNMARLVDFLLSETMHFKCFLRMRMAGIYRENIVRDLPNILLE